MKKFLRRTAVLFLVFVLGVAGTALLLNNETTDDRSDMNNPTLPEVMIEFNGTLANRMYGYRQPMQVDFARDSLTPLDTTKTLTVVVNPYETKVSSLSYEIRTSDGSKVIENKKIKSLKESEGYLRTTIEISSDLFMNQEYSMQIYLDTNKGDAYYYTRVISRPNLNAGDYVRFVQSFYEKCMDKATADDLASYLEPEESAATNFSNITIHSTLSQVSWGSLKPQIYKKGIPVIKDINETTGSISLQYQISAKDSSGELLIYDVTEFYRLRYDETRIRLLNFNRSAAQVFNPDASVISESGLLLGVGSRDVNYMTNEDASVTAFVRQGDLWTYEPGNSKLVRIFSFRKDEDGDFRDSRQEHDIKIIRVQENGDVDFVLYGYMNRGSHEGYSGVCVYHYSSDQNVVEERVFIPCTESPEFLNADLGTLSYVSSDNALFLLFAQKLYLVEIENGSYKILDEGILNENFVVSDTNAHAAWLVQEGNDAGCIKEIDFDTLETRRITPENGQQLRTFGFMNEDLIYGVLNDADILTDDNGRVREGVTTMYIEGFDGTVKKEYHQDGLYITDISIGETLMEFELSAKDGNTYVYRKKDNIMNNQKAAANQVTIELVSGEKTGTQIRLAFEEDPLSEEPLIILAKMRSVEDREITLDTQIPKENIYYVYAYGGLDSVHTDPAKAIQRADEQFGVVLNRAQQYVWERGNKKTHYQMNLEDIPEAMRTGVFDQEQIQKALGEEGMILDLTGCTLDSVLYEVSAQRPVLAKTGADSCVIIIGYDEYNTYLYDPKTGDIKPYGMNDSTALFEKAGNVFLSYMEEANY